MVNIAGGRAVHVLRRAEQRRQGQHQNEDRGGRKTKQRGAAITTDAVAERRSPTTQAQADSAAGHVGPGAPFQPPATISSRIDAGDLPDIERGERGADVALAAGLVQVVAG